MKIINVLKVADYDITEVSAAAFNFISLFIAYEDKVLHEPLLALPEAIDSPHFDSLPEETQKEIRKMLVQCEKRDCAYVRFVDERPVTTKQALALAGVKFDN